MLKQLREVLLIETRSMNLFKLTWGGGGLSRESCYLVPTTINKQLRIRRDIDIIMIVTSLRSAKGVTSLL